MTGPRCPTCKKTFERSESKALPFCSERCRLIDLGRWLGEDYPIPVERDPDQDAPYDDVDVDEDANGF